MKALRKFHVQQPEEPGIDRGRLRRMAEPSLCDALWRAVIDELVQRQAIKRNGLWLHLPEHRITLNDWEVDLAQKLQAAIGACHFDPPWVRDLAATVRVGDEDVRRVLRKCVMQGTAFQIVLDLFYHRDCVRELARVLRTIAREHEVVETARYRDAISIGRKRAIQILEFFDRVGYTRRLPHARVVRADSSWHDEG